MHGPVIKDAISRDIDAPETDHLSRVRKLLERRRTWTEQNDQEIEYDRWYFHEAKDLLEEENRIRPQRNPHEIWPRWGEGVPTKFRRWVSSPFFSLNGVRHRPPELF
jgi:hypothetical protein